MILDLVAFTLPGHLFGRGDYVEVGRTLYRVVAVIDRDVFIARRAGRGERVRFRLTRWVARGRRLFLGALDSITQPLRKGLD